VLSENVANSDTPGFRPSDLKELDLRRVTPAGVTLAQSNPMHFAAVGGGDGRFQVERDSKNDVRPAGNAVSLEDEMMKVAQNQMDYQAASMLYSRSLNLLKTALGKR
jgi:flagellar basal-body rod protein FlgB